MVANEGECVEAARYPGFVVSGSTSDQTAVTDLRRKWGDRPLTLITGGDCIHMAYESKTALPLTPGDKDVWTVGIGGDELGCQTQTFRFGINAPGDGCFGVTAVD